MSIHNSTYEFPDDFVETLVCSHCKAYLSCGSIKVKPDGGTICGRCSGSNMEGSIRHSLFESVMAKFMFPCRFKKQGCGQQLVFGAVEHEDKCPYRTYACPSLPHGTCTQNVSVFDVYKHFEESHYDLIVKDNKFRLDLQADVQCNLLVSANDVVAMVQYMYDSDKQDLYLDITHFSNDFHKRLSYKLQIVSGSDLERSINFKDYSCRLYECHAINQQSSRHFKLSNYLPALEHPDFVFVNIILQCVDGGANNRENFSQMGEVNSLAVINTERKIDKMIDALEVMIRCQCCYSIAIPPAYNCQMYSTRSCIICFLCTNSTTAKSEEFVVIIPEFPCRWRLCSFVGNETTIKDHIESCQFQTYICPLFDDCFSGFYTRNTMMNHIQEHGGQFCANPDRIVIDLFRENSVKKHYFTIFNNRLVAFTYFIEEKGGWVLDFKYDTLDVSDSLSFDIYFKHNHCSYKSKTFSYSSDKRCQYNYIRDYWPKCFTAGKCWWAVIKINN